MFELIRKLCMSSGVSGNEGEICQTVSDLLLPYADVTVTDFGNVIATFGNKDADKTILLDAHLDQIGFVITDITSNGFLKAEKCGGIDLRTVQGCGVIVHGKEKLKGVVCCLPPHLSDGNEDKAISADKVYIDIGLPADEVEKLISVGDTVTFAEEPVMLLNNRITSPALDNRASVAAVIKVAQLLEGQNCPYKVTAILSSQEETYQLGAKTGAYISDADEAVVLDVSFSAQPGINDQYSEIELSEGQMLCISPTLCKPMYNKLKNICIENSIPYQNEVCSGRTGTNADSITICKSGIKTALVSIPQKNMHTQAEIVDINDVENTARLIFEYIMQGGAFGE
ncbi:MAG: M20/M25/M40 family metallo-hydrolase [Oscillospiraceae bacterium]|nr:M20/M25/M40 family metallo-hydrolase [Oscillospiraceae bacterium]